MIKSKYIKQFWKVDNEQQVLEILRSESRKYDVKPVLIACADNLSSMLDVNYNELSCHYILPGSKQQGHITKLMNKEVMRQLALDVGFIVPNSKATDTAEENEIDVPFPWIIKPLIRHGQLIIWTWLQDILRTNRFMEFDKNDNAPFWCYLKQRIIDCLKRF